MSSEQDFINAIKHLAQLPKVIGEALDPFGGTLRCHVCGDTRAMEPGDAGLYTAHGWPECHDSTMTWWTARQIAAGEMPT